MADLKPGWTIVGNDGHHFGTVKSVGQNYILASTTGLGGQRYVPASNRQRRARGRNFQAVVFAEGVRQGREWFYQDKSQRQPTDVLAP